MGQNPTMENMEQERRKEERERKKKALEDERDAAKTSFAQAQAGKAQAEAEKIQAEAELRKIEEERDQLHEDWRKGVQPVILPTLEQILAAKKELGFTSEARASIAVVGTVKSGKSTFINSVRGLRGSAQGTAFTDTVEATIVRGRYPDTKLPVDWYDIPGAGTPTNPSWQYFNNQRLFAFDCIIILVLNTIREEDMAILHMCSQLKPPILTFIVFSHSDTSIDNMMVSQGRRRNEDRYRPEAQDAYIKATRENVETHLKAKQLPIQRVYNISAPALCDLVVKHEEPGDMIDEARLVHDLQATLIKRRACPDFKKFSFKS